MPGVMRPNTLIDLLGVINGQSQATGSTTTGASATGFGVIAEGDESIPATSLVDAAASVLLTAVPGWDQEVWCASVWQ